MMQHSVVHARKLVVEIGMSVTYNAENRPVRWERGNMVVTMNFDRMGHRVEC